MNSPAQNPSRLSEALERHIHALQSRKKHIPLAWRNATRDRKRLIQAAVGIGFAATLIFMQLGLRNGFIESAMQIFYALDGDLFVVSSVRHPPSRNESFPRRRFYQAMSIPGVASVAPVYITTEKANWTNPDVGSLHTIRVVAFDPDRPALRLPGLEDMIRPLRQPNTVLMDNRARRLLGNAPVGTETVLTGRQIEIVGTFPMGPNFEIDGTLMMSDRNYHKFFFAQTTADSTLNQIEFGVIKLASGIDAGAVKEALLRDLPGDIAVLTREEIIDRERQHQLAGTPVGPIFALGTMIGFLVGMIIAYQIMFTDIADRRPQYATLRAMGFGGRYLIGVVVRQSAYFGLAGFMPALLVSVMLYALVEDLILIPMAMALSVVALTFALTVGMCVVAGLFAARGVFAADPAELFR